MKKTLLILLILSSVAKADPFSDIWKWVEDSPEIAVPALVLGAPLAIAAAPMIASYALFPVVSGAGYLLPEATMETIAGLGMETAVGVGETAVGESVGTVGAETMAEFSSAFGETCLLQWIVCQDMEQTYPDMAQVL
ncbi:hypothetical protein BSPWISOXPB_4437 [uncultured Gammaproteobacteria bacterium]|nr:hypothetical protein BSPWISOXPB_4437 [uncultured Gammaproteobacteria bacterium]